MRHETGQVGATVGEGDRGDAPLALRALILSDYRALYGPRLGAAVDDPKQIAIRFISNPALRATAFMRVANACPRGVAWWWRGFLLKRYGLDWSHGIEVGPGLRMPHPVGVVIVEGVRIGSNVLISHQVTLGGDGRHRVPSIGNDVEIFSGAVIIGAEIGDGAVIGALSFVNRSVPPRTVVKRDVIEPLERA